MTSVEKTFLVNYPSTESVPRAVRWAWYEMPKTYWSAEGERIRITKIGQELFLFLKRNKETYYQFLKENGLEMCVYDKYIGKYEPEPRKTW